MREDISKRLVRAEHYLKSREDIAFAYLFGSYAQGKEIPLSDVDIAVYLTKGKFRDKRFEILGDLIDLLKTDKLDLVILNSAALSLKMKIIQTKRVVADNFPFIRHAFESATMRTYMDFSKIEIRLLEKRFLYG